MALARWAPHDRTGCAPLSEGALTVGVVVRRSSDWLAGRGSDTPRLDAEILIGHALGLARIALYTESERPLSPDETSVCRVLIARRGELEPVAHITGRRAFGRLEIQVTPDVLVPRPDTEILVDRAVEVAPRGARVADWGTGSGAIALSLADLRPDVTVTGLELSPAALAVAEINLAANPELAERVRFLLSDGLAGLGADRVDVVVSNPPYLVPGDLERYPALRHEPEGALLAGPLGTEAHARVAAEASRHLTEGGWLVMEVGQGQGPAVEEILAGEGFADVSFRPDLAGIPRVVSGQRR